MTRKQNQGSIISRINAIGQESRYHRLINLAMLLVVSFGIEALLLSGLVLCAWAQGSTVNEQAKAEADLGAVLLFDGDGFCSGSLISENTVLTAAHCLKGGDGLAALVGGEIIETESYTLHPLFDASDPHSSHDLAMVRLKKKPRPSKSRVRSFLGRYFPRSAIVSGYGGGTDGLPSLSAKTIGLSLPITGGEAFGFNTGAMICRGDSGAAVLVPDGDGRLKITGVLSRSSCLGWVVFSMVDSEALAWIDRELARKTGRSTSEVPAHVL